MIYYIIQRRFVQWINFYKDFETALNFVNNIGDIAEEEAHHPDIRFTWGIVELTLFTHKINGLSENDFILAARINKGFYHS